MRRIIAAVIAAMVLGAGPAAAQAFDVLTHHNDIYRSGVYGAETSLNPNSVNPRRFGKLFTRDVIGQVWGQPLYMRGVTFSGAQRNLVYVATSENWVYAFDADDLSPDDDTAPLAKIQLGSPAAIGSDICDTGFHTISPTIGVISTPVIDPASGMLYVVARIRTQYQLFALDLATLAVRKSVTVAGSVSGIAFDPSCQMTRPALLLAGGHLVVAFGSGPATDNAAFHGWVMSYAVPNLTQTGIFNTTPYSWNYSQNGLTGSGSIWQSGNGPAADDQGNVYVMVGNGMPPPPGSTLPDVTNSIVKLANGDGSLRLADWYTPPSRRALQLCDLDLGSSGPAVLPAFGKVLGAGKSAVLYVLDAAQMGGTDTPLADPGAWTGAPDCTKGQCFRVGTNRNSPPPGDAQQPCGNGANWNNVLDSYPHVHGAPVAWTRAPKQLNLYVWPEEDFLGVYRFNGQQFAASSIGSSAPITAAMESMPGGMLSLSWDGAHPRTALIWASRPYPFGNGARTACFDSKDNYPSDLAPNNAPCNAIDKIVQGYLEAFIADPNADGRLVAIWNSQMLLSDNVDWFAKNSPPTIADGKVFLAAFPPNNGPNDYSQPGAIGHLVVFGAKPPVAAKSRIDRYWGPGAQQHVNFVDVKGHVHELFIDSGRNWVDNDLMLLAHSQTAATPLGGIAGDLGGNDQEHVNFLDARGHVHELYYPLNGPWQDNDLMTFARSAASAAKGSPVDRYWGPGAQQHVNFIATNGHVHELFIDRGHGWIDNDLMQLAHSGTIAAAAGGMAGDLGGNNQQHVNFLDGRGHVHELYYPQDGPWQENDLMASAHTSTTAAPGSVVARYWGPGTQQHVDFIDGSGHVHELFIDSGHGWIDNNLMALAHTGTTAAPGSGLDGYVTRDGAQHVNFVAADGHIHELYYPRGGPWRDNDLMALAKTSATAAPTSALAGDGGDNNDQQHVNFFDGSGQVDELWIDSGRSWAENGLR
jgi:hypothetical protein